jgi:LAO/AO transport system kinase
LELMHGKPRDSLPLPSTTQAWDTLRLDLSDYKDGILSGDRRALSKAITLVESSHPDHRAPRRLDRSAAAHTGNAVRLGISGVPGAGKSTFIESFGMHLVDQGHAVAVLAVDPSSKRSGGSILADKTRMERLSAARRAFIRPSPSGGTLGGVARMTRETMLLCEAAGFDVIIVETVGWAKASPRWRPWWIFFCC